MSQPRYERLSTNVSNQDDDTNFSQRRTSQHLHNHRSSAHDEDDENEEIELGNEHRLQFHDDELDADYHTNGHTAATIGSVHNEGGGMSASTNAHHLPGSRFMQMAIGTLATILLYLSLSICLTFYQKALIKKLKFPLSIVSYHLVIKYFLSAIVRCIYKCRMGKSRVQLDCRTAVRKMAPTGIASGIDIGFSNWGLELVPISLYTMTKSSTIVFILFFAILLGLEKKSWSLVMIVSLIATGLFMFTYKSTQFDALGFSFILVASLSSGVRWSFAQFVMQKSKLGLHNPVDMIFHMQPWMIASILPFLIAFEGQKLFDILRDLSEVPNIIIYEILFKITFGAVLAFLMEVSEFLVLSKTSSLTLSIAGIFKDICQLALAVELNGDQLSLMNVFGLIVCLAGICCHLVHKYSTLVKMEELNHYDDEDLQYNETSISTNGGTTTTNAHHNASSFTSLTAVSFQNKHSAQTIPLLENSDSDDSQNPDEPDASDVIFDVLKRRDVQR